MWGQLHFIRAWLERAVELHMIFPKTPPITVPCTNFTDRRRGIWRRRRDCRESKLSTTDRHTL